MSAYTGSKAQTSQGTILEISSTAQLASPPVWVTVSELTKGKFNDKNEFDESTNTQSLAKEFLATLPDNGNFEFTLNRVSTDAGLVLMQASYDASPPTLWAYHVVFPINKAAGQSTRGDERIFNAYVQQLPPEFEANKKIGISGSLKLSGPITKIEGA